MNQNKTLQHLLHSVLLGALAICSSALAQNRPVTQYFYDANGNLTSTVDGLNRVTTQSYDTLDRLRRITQPPPAAAQPNPVIQLELNGRDDLTKVIDPRNLSTTYGVTGLSNVTTQTSPDTGVTTRTFDAAGNVKTSRDARGRTTTYTYDALHRLTQASYGDGTLSTYVYDQGANGVGRLTSMTDPGPITTSWTYTAMGRVATKVQTIGTGTAARTHQLIYNYNPTTGQVTSVTYPSGKLITYTYGATSKDLERIAINGANAASAITYHPFGGVKRMTLGNSQVWSNSLDQDGRVKTYTLGAVTYTIAWDAANRITGITSSQTATNRTFGYDNLDRITSFSTTGRSQSFSYDATGNLLAKTDVTSGTTTNYTFSVAPTSNRLTGISNLGIGYSFDAAGNRTGDGRITYAYNYRGRLNQVRIINGAVTNTYDYLINGINLRVRKTGPSTVVPQGVRIFVYDDAARLIGEYDDLGRARIEHVWLDDRPVAAITYTYTGTSMTPATTTTSYVETDHLATPRLITNASRQKRWTWESAPYGDTFPNENPQALGAYNYNLRFPGQYFDSETNHHYNHHRDYESTTGRYVQSDPIGLKGGINTYSYVSGKPTRYSDRLGLWSRAAHDYFLSQAFIGLDSNMIAALQAGSQHADSFTFQGPDFAFMHAMSSQSMTPDVARTEMCKFVQQQLALYKQLASAGRFYEAFFQLGVGLHPIMDSTSPAHRGFQYWPGILLAIKQGIARRHGDSTYSEETLDVAYKYRDETVTLMQQVLRGDLSGCGCGQ